VEKTSEINKREKKERKKEKKNSKQKMIKENDKNKIQART
jgi:hypothetical protein